MTACVEGVAPEMFVIVAVLSALAGMLGAFGAAVGLAVFRMLTAGQE